MKVLRYQICYPINMGTEENPNYMDSFVEYTRTWSIEDEELVKQTAYNGEYTIEDDGIIPAPTQLDIIEAQVTYTAMMTDTLLEG